MIRKIKSPLFLACLLTFPVITQADTDGLPCPDSPNCVSSLEEGKHYIEPFFFKESSPAKTHKILLDTLNTLPGYTLTSSNGHIIHTVFTSSWLKFEDDLIFLISKDGRVDVKSASRVGYYDFGANRKRVENLRQLIQSELQL